MNRLEDIIPDYDGKTLGELTDTLVSKGYDKNIAEKMILACWAESTKRDPSEPSFVYIRTE